MAVNKIVLNTDDGEQVLVDLTGDSVSEGTLFEGETAHAANGEKIVGTFTLESEMYEQDTLIEQIKTALEGKAAGGGGTDALDSFVEGATEITSNASVVGDNVFRTNYKIKKATFTVATTIGSNAFYYNSVIEEVYAPELLTIGGYAFYSATKLKKIHLPKAIEFNTGAFQGCTNILEMHCPSLQKLGFAALQSCKALTEICMPSLVFINGQSLRACDALAYVDVGSLSSNSYLYALTFYDCTSLTSLVMRVSKMINLENVNVFTNTPIANGTGYIYIPLSLIASFQTATNWSTFANQFRALEDYTVDGTVTGEFDRTKI